MFNKLKDNFLRKIMYKCSLDCDDHYLLLVSILLSLIIVHIILSFGLLKLIPTLITLLNLLPTVLTICRKILQCSCTSPLRVRTQHRCSNHRKIKQLATTSNNYILLLPTVLTLLPINPAVHLHLPVL